MLSLSPTKLFNTVRGTLEQEPDSEHPILDPDLEEEGVLIRATNLHKTFGEKKVLQGISFDVHENEVVAIVGTSGCGKSTLLRVIAGLEAPDAGESGGEVRIAVENFGMVFQYSALFDSLSVFENVAFSLLEEADSGNKRMRRRQSQKRKTMSEQEMREVVKEKLALVGLNDIEDHFPNELSGGMQKRVSFARAVMSNPRIILFDEPTAGLDPVASKSLEEEILKLRDQLNAACMVVTHEFHTIFRTAQRIFLLHEGKIHWIGTPQELLHEEDPVVKEFAEAGMAFGADKS